MKMPAIFPVTAHTDFVGAGTTFVAIKGFAKNGLDYVPLALERGATHIVVDESTTISQDMYALLQKYGATLQRVADTRASLADLSAHAAGFPAHKLKIIGITGTKGKTTTSFITHHLLSAAGYNTALMTTVYNRIGSHIFKAPLTTAQPDYLHQFLKLCVEHDIEYVVMETAAQAFSMNRVAGISFAGIIFTNFSQEHLEFYPNMQTYFEQKSRIFEHANPEAPVIINIDNEWLTQHKNNATTISLAAQDADWSVTQLKTFPHLDMRVSHDQNEYRLHSPALVGEFNIYNCLTASVLAHELGVAWPIIQQGLATFSGVPGRVQKFELPNGAQAIIDYAHNPLSFENIFKLLRSMTDDLIVVFGAGGDRDKTRRPLMGALAEQWADYSIITTDNPRSEDAAVIAQEIMAGISGEGRQRAHIELDREQAIIQAYKRSRTGSIIALLGKGPDEYQIFGDQKIFFSEAQIIKALR